MSIRERDEQCSPSDKESDGMGAVNPELPHEALAVKADGAGEAPCVSRVVHVNNF